MVRQHESISRIYPHSVNTVRVDTFLDDEGNVHLLSGLMRFGAGGSVVDNGSSGGCFVFLDLETGRLRGVGKTYLEHGGAIYPRHPDTNVSFDGFQVPDFPALIKLVKDAAALFPNRLVGWDVAVTGSGPLLPEGNHNHHLGMSEMAYGGYRAHPVFSTLLQR